MRRDSWTSSIKYVLLVGGLVAAVPLCAADLEVRDRDADWLAPSHASAKANPLANRPDAAGGGGKLFQERCATCHGEEGRGTSKAPNLTQPEVQAQTDGALFWKISSGNTHAGMPAFSFLPEPQRWQLVLHVRALAVVTPSTTE
jgi:mono/diheme cytochrome c family protein